MQSKNVYFILSEEEVHIGISENDQFRWLDRFVFQQRTDFYYKEQLQQLIEKHELNDGSYDEQILMWYTSTSTLIPMNLLEESTPKELIEHSFSAHKVQYDVDYNRISELSLVNIYEIPLWVKSFFVIRFPRIVMQHLGTGMLRGIFNSSSFKPTIHVILMNNFALLIYVKHNELVMYNSYDFASENDLIYYTINTLTQTNSLDLKGAVSIHELANSTFQMDALIAQWNAMANSQNFPIEHNSIQTLKYLASCV